MNPGIRNLHFFWLLIIAVFFHSAAPAFVLPIQAKPEALSITKVAAAHSAEHCQESADSSAPHHQSHDKSACQIACDLSSTPALITAYAPDTGEAPAVLIPVLHALRLAAASPPDHPPPI